MEAKNFKFISLLNYCMSLPMYKRKICLMESEKLINRMEQSNIPLEEILNDRIFDLTLEASRSQKEIACLLEFNKRLIYILQDD